MKLTSFTVNAVASQSTVTGPSSESKTSRENRMKAFWSAPENARVFTVGKVLATLQDGKTLAEWLIEGESIEMASITVNGITLPLQPDFILSLDTLDSWGCPACRSAHGSGAFHSREKDAKLLASNKFYYNPVTRSLFTISTTCWGSYVQALGAATPQRFTAPVASKKGSQAKQLEAPKASDTILSAEAV